MDWAQALRQVVRKEEKAQHLRRTHEQKLIKERAQQTSTLLSSEAPPAPEDVSKVETNSKDTEEYTVLSSPTATWEVLEDTEQAVCVSLNRANTVLAVGERDGRISLWDNTTIRVITRELDPAMVSLPPPDSSYTSSLSIEEVEIVKSGLKAVQCLEWSYDSRLLFAACEEKQTKRGRLCVWDVQTASLLSTYSFDARLNALSSHPSNPDILLVCVHNKVPTLLDLSSKTTSEVPNVPLDNDTITGTIPSNSRLPSLLTCARFSPSGDYIYVVTSKSTVSVLSYPSFSLISTLKSSVLMQHLDLTTNAHSILVTSSKGIHEYHVDDGHLSETRMYVTGAVRAPWSACWFSPDQAFVIGMPLVRHRHIGGNGLYAWPRTSGSLQHNAGVKDGVANLAVDRVKDAYIAVSTSGALFVLEEPFVSSWPGPMYPAGFRVITDNEIHVGNTIIETSKQDTEEGEVDVDTFTDTDPQTYLALDKKVDVDRQGVLHLPSIPVPPAAPAEPETPREEEDDAAFGLDQSVFMPLPAAACSKKKRRHGSTKGKSKRLRR